MNQREKARQFLELHVKGSPVILYNAWDAGSAKTIAAAGAKVIATSSWAVAAAQGYKDGEAVPLELVEQITKRIASTVDNPITVDFEGGYSDNDRVLAENITRLIDLGIAGINFEDRVVQGTGLHDINRQAQRIATIRQVAEHRGVELVINARTDVFFLPGGNHQKAYPEAIERAKAYATAGASSLFTPGLIDAALIGKLCSDVALPVNIMIMQGASSNADLARLGVSRISYGNIPYVQTMEYLGKEAKLLLN